MTESTSVPQHHPRAVVAAAVGVAVVGGALTALQTRVNSQFAIELRDGVLASFISFGSGLLILGAIVLVTPGARLGISRLTKAVASGHTPWWYLTGGAFGAFFVLSQGLTAAALGVALFTIAVVASQTVSGAVIDGVGLGDLAKRPVTVVRAAASVLAVAAVGFAGASEMNGDVPPALLLLPIAAGLGIGWQQAINGQVRHVSQSALAATFLNFLVGTAVLLAAAVIHGSATGWAHTLPTSPLLYTGGAIGVLFIGGAVAVVRITGVLLLGLGTIAGQLTGALLLDLVVPIPGRELAGTTVIGTALTLVAVSIAVLSTKRPTARPGAARS